MRARVPAAVLAAGLLASASAGTASGAEAGPVWRPDVRAAASYAATRRAGSISFAVRAGSRLYGTRVWARAPMASTLKVMLMVAYLRRPAVTGRALSRSDRALLGPMVRWSDNGTASRLRLIVGTGALYGLARRAGMRCFASAMPIWGLSRTCAVDQARFMLGVDGFVPARHRAYAMGLLGSIVRSQRWGVARVRPRGWELYFKSGWGSGTGWVDHQVALLRRGGQRVGLAVLVRNSPSHAYGKQTLEGIARRLLRGLATAPR